MIIYFTVHIINYLFRVFHSGNHECVASSVHQLSKEAMETIKKNLMLNPKQVQANIIQEGVNCLLAGI